MISKQALSIFLPVMGMVNALGENNTEIAFNLLRGDTSGMISKADLLPDREIIVGEVSSSLPIIPIVFQLINIEPISWHWLPIRILKLKLSN